MKNVLLIHGFNGIPPIFNYFKEALFYGLFFSSVSLFLSISKSIVCNFLLSTT